MSYPMKAIEATIPINTALSDIVDTGGGKVVGVIASAAWDAATLGFLGGMDGVNMYTLDDGTAEIAETIVAGGQLALQTNLEGAGRYIQLRSGTKAVPVNQTAARTLYVLVRP